MTESFDDIIKRIRHAAHAAGPYSRVTYNVLKEICGDTVPTFTEMFDKMCDILKTAHEKELEDMRRDVADEAEEAKNLMVADIAKSYEQKIEAMQEEYSQKVKAVIDKSLDPQRLYGAKPNTFDGVLEALKEFRWQHATNDTDVIPYINRLKAVHDMEIQEVAAHYELDHCPSCKARLDQQDRAETMEHVRKEQYHRGYQDGLKARDVGMWQLDHDRAEVLARLVNSNLESGLVMRSLCFVLGVDWRRYNTTRSLGEMKARLAYLLGGAVEDSKLQKSPNFANASTIIELSDDYANLVAERDSILDLLKDAAKEYKELLDKYLAAPWEAMQPMDDEHMSKLGWMRAIDRDGEPICMGDTVRNDEENVPFGGETFKVTQITHFRDGSCYVSGGFSTNAKSYECTHVESNPDQIEQTIRDLNLGEITETEAIERLHEIIGS